MHRAARRRRFSPGAVPVLAVIGIYTVGAYCRPRQIAIGYAVMFASLVILWIIEIPDFNAGDVFSNTMLYSVSLEFGWAVQSRRLRLEAAEERAEILEREQAQVQARAIADERLHIAQELHDVMAHSMSVIAVQAGVGMHVADTDAAEAKQALQNISTTSRSTLVELRRLLGVLRDDGHGASYAPAPGLADLDQLAQDVSDAGVPVSVRVDGALDDVPPGVGFTGYRIVQEALTNVLKHAGPSTASVRVAHEPGSLHIEVCDDGRGVNGRSSGVGHGLMGMRERVAVYGGRLDAGPIDGGGFKVSADLPVRPMIRVGVADDQALVRSGFSVLLKSADDIEVVGEAADGAEAVRVGGAGTSRRDVDGHPDARDGRARSDAAHHERRRRDAGADPHHLRSGRVRVRGLARRRERVPAQGHACPTSCWRPCASWPAGESLLAPKITTRLIADFVQRPAETKREPNPALETLTERETEVLGAVAKGLSNAEIADELFMSHATAKTHVSRLLSKLHARDRAQLVVIAYESGVAGLGRP